jgi:hypothetical protein
MMSQGISLILVDDENEIPSLLPLLHIDNVVALDDMINHLDTLYDEVFYVLFTGPESAAEKYLHMYNVRRAIVVHSGKAKAHGRDLTWIKAVLGNSKREVVRGVLPEPKLNLGFLDRSGGFSQPEEKDDPYAELGYRR